MSSLHELKVHPGPFQAMADGRKPFEFRRNDRDFQVGDCLHLREWRLAASPYESAIAADGYTGRELTADIAFILHENEFGVPPGYAVLGLPSLALLHPPSGGGADPLWAGDLERCLRFIATWEGMGVTTHLNGELWSAKSILELAANQIARLPTRSPEGEQS